jgi:hypothetical protein
MIDLPPVGYLCWHVVHLPSRGWYAERVQVVLKHELIGKGWVDVCGVGGDAREGVYRTQPQWLYEHREDADRCAALLALGGT